MDNGSKMTCTAKEYTNGQMVEHMRVSTFKIRNKVMAFTHTLTEEATKEIGRMVFNTVKDYAYIQTEKKLKDYGTLVKD